ncbi:MAG: VanW family protein [Oscillibacter sp.]|nr:VanW family protein [Oscillibacter sp.]
MEQAVNQAAAQKKRGSRLQQEPASRPAGRGGKRVLAALGIAACVLAAGYGGLCAFAAGLNTFYPNYTVNGIAVGGLTASQAQAALEAALPAQVLTLKDGETVLASVTAGDLGYTREGCAGIAQGAMERMKSAGFLGGGIRYLASLSGSTNDDSVPFRRDDAMLDQAAADLAEDFSQSAQDGSYVISGSTVTVTKSRPGRLADAEQLRSDLAAALEQRADEHTVQVVFTDLPARAVTAQEIYDAIHGEMKNASYDAATDTILPEQVGASFDIAAAQSALDSAADGASVTLEATIETPAVTAEDLAAVLFRDVLGEARTHVSGTANRISNVKLAAASFNNTVLNSGDVFSYNQTVGQRTAAKGYKPAPAYVQGETVDEIGGGVCQPSSTLYLASLRANLQITERYAHRYIPAYITPGMDATVSWGGPDYKFTNSTDYPIRIRTVYEGGYLTVQLLGTKTDGTTVKMTNELLSTTPYETVYQDDPTLAPGTETVKTTPYTGYKYKTYRNVYAADGTLLSSTFEATSDYKARNKVILKSPEAAPAVDPVVTPTDPTVTPTDPEDPTPVTPTEPTAPTTPTEPVTPAEPTDPAEPEDPWGQPIFVLDPEDEGLL